MISKAKLKAYSAYKTQKNRDKDKVFVVEGVKLSEELLNSGFSVIDICATKEWIADNPQVSATEISESELERISLLQTPNQVWALVERKDSEVIPENAFDSLCLVLDEIKDPGNMGTIIRTADWFGIRNIVCSQNSVDIYNPKVIQSTMGSIFRMQVYYTDLKDFLSKKPQQTKVFGALLGGDDIYKKQLDDKGIILIGNESKGISDELKPFITDKITIPRFGEAESLNAAVATGIVLSEFKRGNRKQETGNRK